ncbi:maltose ABC transporter substrate-binding protein [Metabacillus dongyingensis]|uniref:sugar ABC transporter substrate-binding protein n=1 Tax=Metabacillus dongyingensis TaxID=2874282 RepID=UPI003B8B0993
MRKILSLSLIALLMFVMVACSKPSSQEPAKTEGGDKEGGKKTEEKVDLTPEEGAELVLWDNADSEAEWASYVAEEFTKKYDIPVEVQEVNHVDAAGKLEVDGPAGLGADVFHAPHDHVGNMVKAGLIYENVLADEYKENFLPAAISGTSYTEEGGESTLYGFPMAIETYALYYNKDLVDKPAETFDEIFEQSKGFAGDGKYGFMMEPANFYFAHAFFAGYGGYIFGNDNTDASDLGINNEGAVASGEFMQRMNKELLPLKKEDITGDLISSFFNDNKLMYRISGPWDIKNHEEAGINFGIAPLPKLDNGETPKSFSGIKAYYVNSYSKYPKAATLLAQFATSKDMLEKRFEMTGQLPPQTELIESDAIQNNEIASAFLEQAESALPMPNLPEMQSVWGPMETAYTTMWNDGTEPKKALDAALQQIEDAISSQTK